MNEHLKEIAVKAQVEHCISHVRLEEFARLIVRECAGQVDWILAEGGRTQGDLIREHFGVE
jgi:hypothetical protein